MVTVCGACASCLCVVPMRRTCVPVCLCACGRCLCRYSMDAVFGREVVFPILSGLADFWRCWLTREDGQ